ncbi:MAG TPA: hypothetical protein VFH29_04710 [Anaerolineales bacterium]|nr:hypothetical protein [Anaerolineales bacterium]
MIGPSGAWAGVILAAVTATAVLLAQDWRWQLGAMAVQYVGAAMLAYLHWPLGMAAALLVTGWMTIAAIAMTYSSLPAPMDEVEHTWPEGRAFRLFMAGMVIVLAAGLAGQGSQLSAEVEPPVLAGAILLAGIGALQLGSSPQTGRIILGLLTVLSGFEVYYAAVEGSILVAGLLSIVILGLGLIGAYLMSAATVEDTV